MKSFNATVAFFLLALLAACAPVVTSRTTAPTNTDLLFDAYVNGEKVPYQQGAWLLRRPVFDFSFSLGETTTFFGTQYGAEDISFSLLNKSELPIQIIWDESTIISPDGSSSRVFHNGVRYVDRNNSLPPTLVAPGARIDDIFAPTNAVFYSESLSDWQSESLFSLENARNQTFRLFATLRIGDEARRLDIEFRGRSVSTSADSAK